MKNYKASILVVTLAILSIILVVALSVSLISMKQKESSLSLGKSNIAFQNADTGIEMVLNDIRNKVSQHVKDLDNCSGGKIVDPSGRFVVELRKEDGTVVSSCSNAIGTREIASIKSTGTGANQESRAIEAAVAAGLDCVTQVSPFTNDNATQGCPVDHPIPISGGCDSKCMPISDNYIDTTDNKQHCGVFSIVDSPTTGWCVNSGQHGVSAHITCCR